MPVYRYTASMSSREEHTESGTIFSPNEEEAKRLLRQMHFDKVHLKRVEGISGIVGRFTADFKVSA